MKAFRRYTLFLFSLFTISLFCRCNSSKEENTLKNGLRTFQTSDHVKLRMDVEGQGDPCMFVHGGPGGGYLSFRELGGSSLEKCLQMIYYDQRGSGSSDSAKNYSLDRMVADMEEIRDSLGIDQMYLLSHSFGGILAMQYALKYPEHVKGLILANSTLHFFNAESTKAQVEYGYRLLGKDTAIATNDRDSLHTAMMNVRDKMSKKHLGYKFLTDDVNTIVKLDSLDQKYPRNNDFGFNLIVPLLDHTKKMSYPEYLADFTQRTPEMKKPVLILAGKKDYAIGTKHYQRFHFPDQTVKLIDGGHLLYYEENKAFTSAVCDFVNKR